MYYLILFFSLFITQNNQLSKHIKNQNQMKKTLLAFMMLVMANSLFAKNSNSDVLTLMNEMTFMGKVKKISDCKVKFKTDEGTFWIPADDIYSVQFGDPDDKVLEAYQEMDGSEKCLKGAQDAQNFHGKTGGHIVLGALFGPFAMIGAAVASPNPYKGRNTVIMSQNSNLFNDPAYLKCYKKKAKGRNVGNVAIGWGIWMLAVLLAG